MRALIGIFLTSWFILLAGQPALADKRVALVIGNSSYRNVAKLGNPVNDASVVAAMFKSAGFTVESKLNLTISELRKALRDFGNMSRDADVAVVYYAGHGIELDGANYLIPVDATLETDADVLDEALPLDRVLFAVEPARQLRLVILDACRDNPFAKNMKRTISSRSIGRGLAKVEPSSPNTVIAFAAKAGSTASDGTGKNSPFAVALADHLTKPGLDLQRAFRYVRDDVLKATNNAQEPYTYTSLGGDDVPLVPAAPVKPAIAAPAAAASADQNTTMRRDYEFALQVGTKPVWDAFIEQYPTGFFTSLAKAQRDKLAAETARIEATNKAKAAQEEQARLAAEGAKASEQARAAQQARTAEKARIIAEAAKKAEDAKVAEAERIKAAEATKAAEKEAERSNAADAANAAREAKLAADQKAKDEKLANEQKAKEEKLAALTPPADKSDQPALVDLPRALQAELRRVGCNTGAVDGNWNAAAQRSLDLFNKHTGMKLDVKTASADALDAVKGKTTRVCPLVCDHGFRADGDRCAKITCRAGFEVGNDNTCERIEVNRPVKREKSERAKAEAAPAKPRASGEMYCGPAGCRPVAKGCHLEGVSRNGNIVTSAREICD